MAVFQLSLISIFIILSLSVKAGNTKLLLVQTIFRHGDRAPLQLYPNDPNGSEKWLNGLGELTQRGKRQHYKLGSFFREMYKDFITSDPNEVFVNSSGVSRCLNSALSNVAALYAPTEKFRIAENLNWQPIPVHYKPPLEDIYLSGAAPCPRFEDAYDSSLDSERIREFYRANQAAVQDIAKYSGVNFSDPVDAFFLYDTLNIEAIHNLNIPEWAIKYRNELKAIGDVAIEAYSGSPIQIRLRAGPFLGLVTENMIKKIKGSTPNLKFILNGSHDLVLTAILRALGFFNFPNPPYAATLLFELHEMADSTKAVRLLYSNSTDILNHIDIPQVLTLDGCTEFCPVEKFIKSYDSVMPENFYEECQVNSD